MAGRLTSAATGFLLGVIAAFFAAIPIGLAISTYAFFSGKLGKSEPFVFFWVALVAFPAYGAYRGYHMEQAEPGMDSKGNFARRAWLIAAGVCAIILLKVFAVRFPP